MRSGASSVRGRANLTAPVCPPCVRRTPTADWRTAPRYCVPGGRIAAALRTPSPLLSGVLREYGHETLSTTVPARRVPLNSRPPMRSLAARRYCFSTVLASALDIGLIAGKRT